LSLHFQEPNMTTPFKVKAVYEYTSPHEDDLHFPRGQIITVTEEEDDDWYVGEYVDASGAKKEGIFPRNFVEKYEPTAPPRPVRASRPKKEPEPALAPVSEPAPAPEPEQAEPEVQPQPAAREPSPQLQAVSSIPAPKAAQVSPPSAPKPAPAVSKSIPPPVSEKPSGGSFKDRIAAFNKAAPPVAPFKPGGLSSQGANSFIKKPFVAPPPSRNAYVPPPRETTVAKPYRRDEDPEIAAREAENQEQAERAGLAASSNDADAEDQPKPTSLKERIALLQKQQAEQAARHAEAAQKKEKPKRPAKKRTESHSTIEGGEEGEGAVGERQDTEEPTGKASMDSLSEERDAPRRRKYSRDAGPIPGIPPRVPFIDGNDADMSGAGYTTEEPEEMATIRDDSDEKPAIKAHPPRAPAAPAREPDVGEEEGASEEPAAGDEEEGEEEEEEDDIDPEVRRKEELRARMAKMSGGMGMHGMFGPPGGMPMPGMMPPKNKKSTGTSEARSTGHEADDVPIASTRAPPVPMIPLPGLSHVRSPEEVDKRLEEDEEETPIARTRPTADVPNVEDVVQERNAPPVPGGRPAPPPVPKECKFNLI
jgi:myosin tail region-interacting protein MTI1